MDQSRSSDGKDLDPRGITRVELPKRKFSLEFIVGIFTMLGVGATGYLAIKLGDLKIGSGDQYVLTAEFNDISGLKFGATVEIAGVPVGEITKINLDSKGIDAEVQMLINNNVTIYDEDSFAIRTKGIIGDRYVKVIRGASQKPVSANSRILSAYTTGVVDLEDLVGKLVANFTGGDDEDKAEAK